MLEVLCWETVRASKALRVSYMTASSTPNEKSCLCFVAIGYVVAFNWSSTRSKKNGYEILSLIENNVSISWFAILSSAPLSIFTSRCSTRYR